MIPPPAGSQAGTIVTFPLAAATIGWVGWEAVFYSQAAMALVWCLLWFLLVSNDPDHDPSISRAEKDYINAALGDSKEKKVGHPHYFTYSGVTFMRSDAISCSFTN